MTEVPKPARDQQGGNVVRTSFIEGLEMRLRTLEDRYVDLLSRSGIRNVDPNRRGGGYAVFVGFARWGWVPDNELVAERTHILSDLNDWFTLFRLLHRSALPETSERIDESMDLLRGWLAREGGDHSIPSSIEGANHKLRETFAQMRSLLELGTHGPNGLLVVPDTNSLLRHPDVGTYGASLDTKDFVAVLLPTVLGELDDLKDRGRTPEVRNAAAAAVRRIKGLRDTGDLRTGVRVVGKTMLRAEHREVRPQEVLEWLDPAVPDDRIIGATLDLQARQPSATVVLITSDINLQNKAAAVALPFAEPPD